ncbi:MAG: DUF4404 family protein [Actinomycetota bacterium]|nr:DUF4404 family protein [Actinomycetota bacterium]
MESDLRQLLDELHAAIERTGEGEEDRAELTRLVDAVERRLHEGHDERHGHLLTSLRQAEVRFEGDHPVLGAAIRRAVDALSAAGI